MKIKMYVTVLACAGALVVSALSFRNSASYVSNETADVSLTLNDLFTVAFADEEDDGEASCNGIDCTDANGLKYWTKRTTASRLCCGEASSTRGKKFN